MNVTANLTSINVVEIPKELVYGNWVRFEYRLRKDKFVGDRHVVEIVAPDGNVLNVLMGSELTVPKERDAIRVEQTLYHSAKIIHRHGEEPAVGVYQIKLQPWSFAEHLTRN